MKKDKKVKINREWCKGCGICAAFCPESVLVMDKEGKPRWLSPDKCKRCGLCELRCPDIAIELQ